jgi:hypothetical protein
VRVCSKVSGEGAFPRAALARRKDDNVHGV